MAFLFLKVPHETARLLESVQVPGDRLHIDEMHITLLYLGKGVSILDIAKAMIAAYEVTSQQTPFLISLNQISSFPPSPDDGMPIICPVESAELMDFRAKLAAKFDKLGLNYSKKYEYNPHATLSYVKEPEKHQPYKASLPSISWVASELGIWGGDRGEGLAIVSMPFVLNPLSSIAARVAGIP